MDEIQDTLNKLRESIKLLKKDIQSNIDEKNKLEYWNKEHKHLIDLKYENEIKQEELKNERFIINNKLIFTKSIIKDIKEKEKGKMVLSLLTEYLHLN